MKLPKKSKKAYIRPSEKKRLDEIVSEDLSILQQIKKDNADWKGKSKKIVKGKMKYTNPKG